MIGNVSKLTHHKQDWWSLRTIEVIVISVVFAFILFGFSALQQTTFLRDPYRRYDRFWLIFYIITLAAVLVIGQIRSGRVLMRLLVPVIAIALLIPCITQSYWISLLSFALIFSAAWASGTAILSLLCKDLKWNRIERFVYASALGYAIISYLILALGVMGLLQTWMIFAILIALTLVGLKSFPSLVKPTLYLFATKSPPNDCRFTAITCAIGLLCLLAPFLWSTLEPNDYDGLMYHIGMPQIFLQEGSIFLTAEQPEHCLLAKNASMLYMAGIAIGDARTAKLLHLSTALLTALLLYSFGRRTVGHKLGLAAGVSYLAIPLITWEGGTTYAGLHSILYVTGSLYAQFAWCRRRQWQWILFSGIFAGLALASKITTANSVLAILVIWLLLLYFPENKIRDKVKWTFLLGLSCFLCMAPWMIRDLAWSGNPIFPLLNSYFDSPYWFSDAADRHYQEFFGVGNTLGHFLALPITTHLYPERFAEDVKFAAFGGIMILAVPCFFVHAHKGTRLILGQLCTFCLLTVGIWFCTIQYGRYLAPAIPAFICTGVLNFSLLVKSAKHSPSMYIWLIRASYAFAICWILGTRLIAFSTNQESIQRYPYRSYLGLQTNSDHLSSIMGDYRTLSYIGKEFTSRDKGILTIGERLRYYSNSAKLIPFTKDRTNNSQFEDWRKRVDQSSGQELVEVLQERKISHLLIAGPWLSLKPTESPLLDPQWLRKHAIFEFGHLQYNLFRIKMNDSDASSTLKKNLLDLRQDSASASKSQTKTSMVTIDPRNRIHQELRIQGNGRYLLHGKCSDPGVDKCRVHLDYKDSQGGIIHSESIPLAHVNGISWKDIYLYTPENAKMISLTILNDGTSAIEFWDLSFREIADTVSSAKD